MDNDPNNQTPDDDHIQRLLQLAGERVDPDPARKAEYSGQLKSVWQQEVANNRRRRWTRVGLPLAIAATAVVVVVGLFRTIQPTDDPVVAELIYSNGEFAVESVAKPLGSTVFAGDLLVTQSGAVSIRLVGDTVVQLDASTQVTMRAPNELWLHHGRLFIDAPDLASSIRVYTAWGTIKDIGTQFEVAVDDASLEIAMREGTVELDLGLSGVPPVVASSNENRGDVLTVDAELTVTRSSIASTDDRFDWMRTSAPAFPEGVHQLSTIVEWASRQTGRRLVYDAAITELRIANEMVRWPSIELDAVEASLEDLGRSIDYRINVTETEIQILGTR